MQFVRTYPRLLVALLLCLFGTSAIGMHADVHYCSGHIKSVSLVGKAKSCHEIAQKSCHKSDAKKSCHKKAKSESADTSCKKNCCHNESFMSQLDYDGVTAIISQSSQDVWSVAAAFVTSHEIAIPHQLIASIPLYRPPPALSGIDRRIEMCSFLC